MVINLQEKIYNLTTIWLTVSVLFFLVEYFTGWLEVVTLGGLVAGAFIEGVFVVIGLKLMRFIVTKDFYHIPVSEAIKRHPDALKALVIVAAFTLEGALTICRALPGYALNFGVAHGIFLVLVYPALAVILEKTIMAKEPIHDGN